MRPEVIEELTPTKGHPARQRSHSLGGCLRDLSFGGADVPPRPSPDYAVCRRQHGHAEDSPGGSGREALYPKNPAGGQRWAARKDIVAVAVEYAVGDPPMSYKLLLNSYLSTQRAASREAAPQDARKAAPPAQPRPAPSREGQIKQAGREEGKDE